jgi:flagellin
MALSLQTNYSTLVTQNTLRQTEGSLDQALERLSTGFRINSAADDPAGLQISDRLTEQISGLGVASRNSHDGISMLQTAASIFATLTDLSIQMNDLSIQGTNGSNSDEDKVALAQQIVALADQFSSIFNNANYGGKSLFGTISSGALAATGTLSGFATTAGITYQTGITESETLSVTVQKEASALQIAFIHVGSGATAFIASASAGTASALFTLVFQQQSAMTNSMGALQATLGSNVNSLEANINNIGAMVENLSAARGRIRDTDYAAETANLSKNQMLMQSGIQMLKVSDQIGQLTLMLLS